MECEPLCGVHGAASVSVSTYSYLFVSTLLPLRKWIPLELHCANPIPSLPHCPCPSAPAQRC